MEVRSEQTKWYVILVMALLIHLLLFGLLFIRVVQKKLFASAHDYTQQPASDWAARKAPVVFTELSEEEQPAQQQVQQTAQPRINGMAQAPERIEEESSPEKEQPEGTEHEDAPAHSPRERLAEDMNLPSAPPTTIDEKPRPKRVKKQPKKTSRGAPLKLADITRMYMEQVGDVPVGDFFMAGNPHNLPPDKQIIFERYRNKLGAIIDQHYRSRPFHFQVPLGTSIKLYLALDKSGTFKEVSVMKSSGFAAIDKYCVSLYKEASEQFPPLPDSLDESMFRGSIILVYQQGTTRANWMQFQ